MTDLETMKAMLDKAKIDYSCSGPAVASAGNKIVITVENDTVGYVGFVTEIVFNLDGSLKLVAAWG